MEKVIFPINLSNTHWVLGAIYIQKKEIHYYDSMSGSGKKFLDAMLQWIVDEGREKKQITIDKNEWKLISSHRETPRQNNGTHWII